MPEQCPILETERLLLKPLSIEDAPIMQRIFPDWEVVQYLGSHIPWPYPANGATTYINEEALPAMHKGESWNWSIRRKDAANEMIGEIVVRLSEGENRGFWLAPEHRRKGYMTEASVAVTRYWFETLR